MRVLFSALLLLGACAAPAPPDLWGRGLRRRPIFVDSTYHATQSSLWSEDRYGTGYGGFEVQAGFRAFDRETFGAVRTQGLYGARLLVPVMEGPLAVELGGSFSGDKDEEGGIVVSDGRLFEASLGLRLSLNRHAGTLVPYAGGGVSALYAELDDDALGGLRDDTGTGLFALLGLAVFVRGNEYLALEWRGLRAADLDLFQPGDSANNNQVTIVFGMSW